MVFDDDDEQPAWEDPPGEMEQLFEEIRQRIETDLANMRETTERVGARTLNGVAALHNAVAESNLNIAEAICRLTNLVIQMNERQLGLIAMVEDLRQWMTEHTKGE